MTDGPYRKPSAPLPVETHRTGDLHPWTSIRGKCPMCGRPPYVESHDARACNKKGVGWITVKCHAECGRGCGAEWDAESFQVHKSRGGLTRATRATGARTIDRTTASFLSVISFLVGALVQWSWPS